MSDQPTPETERVKGALHTNWEDLLNHARRLERERDQERARCFAYKSQISDLKEIFDERIKCLREEIKTAENYFSETVKPWEDAE